MSIDPELIESVEALDRKFKERGQDTKSYLEGLLHSEFLTYWDYVHLDTLLSLQTPRTHYRDEKVFIVYHQITELYFNLVLHELNQIFEKCCEAVNQDFLFQRVKRMNNYFQALITSYEIMVDGMDKEQFLKFRMALLPASGFQSVQYRKIELSCTDLINLVQASKRQDMEDQSSVEKLYSAINWKQGATDLETGLKTLTLKMFEERYDDELIKLAKEKRTCNLNRMVESLGSNISDALKEALRQADLNINVYWPLSHYKSAVRYLQRDPDHLEATGGTNWQKYLPPRFQKIIFFPTLWTETEKHDWGKKWVEEQLL